MTTGHETGHGIHAYIRNTFAPGERKNGFYCFENRAVLVPEPNMKKSAVAAQVPEFARKSRFTMYVTGQTAWDDSPWYLGDEWNAYVIGASVLVDDAEHGRSDARLERFGATVLDFLMRRNRSGPVTYFHSDVDRPMIVREPREPADSYRGVGSIREYPAPRYQWRVTGAGAGAMDGVFAPLEFLIYVLAMGTAALAADSVTANEPQFKAFMAFNAERTMEIYRAGQKYEQFRWEPEYLERLASDPGMDRLHAYVGTLGLDPKALFSLDPAPTPTPGPAPGPGPTPGPAPAPDSSPWFI